MTRVTHQVYLVNSEGKRASVCMLNIATADRRRAIAVALGRGFRDFDVDEDADSEAGASTQTVARIRDGKPLN